MNEAELAEKLAGLTQPFRREAGDSLAPELIECVAEYARAKVRRQPVGAYRGKTDLDVAILRLICVENHAADEIIILIDYPDGLARSPVQTMPYLVRNPLCDDRRPHAGN